MPRTITNNTADIYTADLMFEDHGKCFTTVVLGAGDDAWERSLDDDAFYGCWKIVSLQPESVLVTLECTNIEAADTTKLTNVQFAEGTELMGNVFTKVECQSGLFILYMDCLNS